MDTGASCGLNAMDLPQPEFDFSFVDVSLPRVTRKQRPVNVYQILREGWRETRVDMTLRFFLDPNERHGLGTIVIDSLLQLLDESPLIGVHGKTGDSFNAQSNLGSSGWELNTQVDFIDVLAVNLDLGLAVVLENKIGHKLNNPLSKYVQTALETGAHEVLVAVLAPQRRDAPPTLVNWLSASITYEELGAEIKKAPELLERLLAPADLDQRRSLDLLQQFLEARTGGPNMNDLSNEEARLTQWRAHMELKRDALLLFQQAQKEMRALIKARNARLEPFIAERFADKGFVTGWEAHGGNPEDVWNAYHFPEIDWSIELKLSTNPDYPAIYVQVYPGRDYNQITREDLGLPWSESDEALADAFVRRVEKLLAEHTP